RMELLAVIVGLEAIKWENMRVIVYSDSKYVVDSVMKSWVFNWQRTGFKNKKNVDLWKRFLKIYDKHQISLQWVKGHADNPWNNRCDELATKAADGNNLLQDTIFEQEYYAR
ncbi:MAG TPA: ribonuclease H, partial [Chitinophagaceae bacterium]|nr:ribonuclease H [Chitinophagaceae bacterium]